MQSSANQTPITTQTNNKKWVSKTVQLRQQFKKPAFSTDSRTKNTLCVKSAHHTQPKKPVRRLQAKKPVRKTNSNYSNNHSSNFNIANIE